MLGLWRSLVSGRDVGSVAIMGQWSWDNSKIILLIPLAL